MAFFRNRTDQSARVLRHFQARKHRAGVEPLEHRHLLAVVFAESFEHGGGSNNWDSDWVEDGQDDWFRSTQRATDGSQSAEVDGSASNATLTLGNPLDLTVYSSAELTFDWLIESGFDRGEYLSLDVSSNGGATWLTDVRRLSGNVDAENTWHNESLDLTPYSSSNVLIRFRAKVSGSSEDANIDNVQVVGTAPDGPPEISISDVMATEGGKQFRLIDELIAPGSGGLMNARGIEVGPDGHLYLGVNSDPSDPVQTGVVLSFDSESGAFRGVFASHSSMKGAKDVEFGPDGSLYVTDNRSNSIFRFDGSTGAFIDVFVPNDSGGLDTPRQLIFGPDGNGDGIDELYVASAKTDSILRYDGSTGSFLGAFVTAGDGGLNEPTAITFGPDGSLYVASGAHQDYYNSILRYDGTTGDFLGVFVEAGSAGLTLAPTAGMIFGPDVNGDGTLDMYVSNNEVDEVLVFSGGNGSFVDRLISSGQGLNSPKGLLFDDLGSLLVFNNGDGSVRRFGPSSQAVFDVKLSHPSDQIVTVDFSTADGIAQAAVDFEGRTGTVTFLPGMTTRAIIVPTIDDAIEEGNEAFAVNLSAPVGAVIQDGQGIATIEDDDGVQINPNTLFVYDIRFESIWGGWYQRAVFEIRSDSNADGVGSSADAVAPGVAIDVEFAGRAYTGTTDSSGVFRTAWLRNVSSGSHAEVLDLLLAGYEWNPLARDLEDDSDGDGRPDAFVP